jgi:hypothetical protein
MITLGAVEAQMVRIAFAQIPLVARPVARADLLIVGAFRTCRCRSRKLHRAQRQHQRSIRVPRRTCHRSCASSAVALALLARFNGSVSHGFILVAPRLIDYLVITMRNYHDYGKKERTAKTGLVPVSIAWKEIFICGCWQAERKPSGPRSQANGGIARILNTLEPPCRWCLMNTGALSLS